MSFGCHPMSHSYVLLLVPKSHPSQKVTSQKVTSQKVTSQKVTSIISAKKSPPKMSLLPFF